MNNEEMKLNSKFFSHAPDEAPTRDGFGDALVELGKENERVVALTADLKESTRVEAFSKQFPERFFEVGVAEQNLVTIAAGLAVMGKVPFITSYATFSPGRNWEQIRTTVCYNDVNVNIAGHHAGLMTGPDGATHQALEDIALMRTLPNMTVFVPCDKEEARKATKAMTHIKGGGYIRLSRDVSPIITTKETPFIPGKANVLWESKRPKVTIFACGTMVSRALYAAEELEKEGIGSIVINIHTIKPIDSKTIIAYAKKTKCVVTAEEHQIAGGLGSVVAEVLAMNFPVPQEFVGVKDTFGESGTPNELFEKYGLGIKDIKEAVKNVVVRIK
ncbi:MAG: transketolase [Parcubacteria group bacterium LiPW_41]|nr:MAG: transketolase [Parcubacteria group bacterium LiPW_41]